MVDIVRLNSRAHSCCGYIICLEEYMFMCVQDVAHSKA